MASNIKKVGPNHWTAPAQYGYQPHFCVTEHGRKNYPLGAFVREEPLQPNNKIIGFELNEETNHLGEFFEQYSAGGHEQFLDMRVSSVNSRGKGVFLALFLGTIYLVCGILVRLNSKAFANGDTGLFWLDWTVIGVLLAIALVDLFRPLATPVRFHKKNQEVYVWHKGILYRIPWQECEISAMIMQSNMGYGHLSDGYDLALWLNPNHATNKDLSGEKYRRLVLQNVGGKHSSIYGEWEYIRRYMTGEKPLWFEISQRPRVPRFKRKLLEGNIFLNICHYIFMIPFVIIVRPHLFSLWFNPFRHKWPEQVHEWSGERCNWL